MWQKEDDGTPRKFDEGLQYCENLALADYGDWRVPNAYELESITDDTTNNPSINSSVFPNTKTDQYYIASTFSSYDGGAFTFIVDFEKGFGSFNFMAWDDYVRCVRGGQ